MSISLCSAELKQIQKMELEMLRIFVNICEELGLRYYILGGTLLGAVRHRGFIPWDDDIDVGLIREDYDIFLKKAGDMLPQNLFLQSYETEPEYHANMAKIRNSNTTFIESVVKHSNINHGIFIDIFPLDNLYDQVWKKMFFLAKRKVLSVRIGKVFCKTKKDSVIKRLLKVPLNWMYPTLYSAVSKRERLYKEVPYSGMLINYSSNNLAVEAMPRHWFAEGVVMRFEDMDVCAPKEYHKYLTQLYGDYLQLPPVNKRVSCHEVEVVDLHQSYTYYMNGERKSK